jgi:hypothetical protein
LRNTFSTCDKALVVHDASAEPVFGNITSNKGLNRISLRGEAKATAQWSLCCMVHNIEKLWKNAEVAQWA